VEEKLGWSKWALKRSPPPPPPEDADYRNPGELSFKVFLLKMLLCRIL
jgi:hypothetical protein